VSAGGPGGQGGHQRAPGASVHCQGQVAESSRAEHQGREGFEEQK